MKFLRSLALSAALFLIPVAATAQVNVATGWGAIVGASPIAADVTTTNTTVTVDLRSAPGLTSATLTDAQFDALINKGNLYYRVAILTDGTINGVVNVRFSTASNGSAAGTTAATTGAVINEGGEVFVRATARYLHYCALGSDTTHSIAVTRVVPLYPN